MKNWSTKKKAIWIVVIIILILAFVYRNEIMKAFGKEGSIMRKFHRGGALGYWGWWSPSRIWAQTTSPINAESQSIYKISCSNPYTDGLKWYAKCSYPGLTGNFYETIGCADTAEGAMAKARYQIENNAMVTSSRPVPDSVYNAGILR